MYFHRSQQDNPREVFNMPREGGCREWFHQHLCAKLGIDAAGVEVQDVLFHSPVSEELFHGQPGRVADAQQHENRAQHVRDGLWRHLERSVPILPKRWRYNTGGKRADSFGGHHT